MSHISDLEVEEYLARAADAGIAPVEIARWRQELHARSLDLCGCEASAKAAIVAAAVVGIRLLVIRHPSRLAIAGGGAGIVSAALTGKVLGQKTATQRRATLLRSLAGRAVEIQSWPH